MSIRDIGLHAEWRKLFELHWEALNVRRRLRHEC